LDAAADVMAKNPNYTLRIVGHADDIGSAQFNQRLSERRAEACFDYLLNKGVAANRMSFVGYGEEVPAATNRTPAGRRLNRRVEVGSYRN
jgi:OmpA-OmpF porin, OOP family